MPDLQNHVVGPTGVQSQVGPTAVTKTPQYSISGTVKDSTSGAVLATYNFTFPECLAGLSAANAAALMQLVARFLITVETGY